MLQIKHAIAFMLIAVLFLCGFSHAKADGWLGITIEPPQGVQVGEIIKGGPADVGGLKRGDIIQKANGRELKSINHFMQTISANPAGTEVVLTVLRLGQEQEIKVKLEDSHNHPSVSQTPANNWLRMGNGLPPPGRNMPNYAEHEMAFPNWEDDFQPPDGNFPPAAPSQSAWLGVALGLAQGGVAVKDVGKSSPGEQAGLKRGDIIVAIGGQAVATPAAIIRNLQMAKPGDLVEIAITREGKTQTLQAQLHQPLATP